MSLCRFLDAILRAEEDGKEFHSREFSLRLAMQADGAISPNRFDKIQADRDKVRTADPEGRTTIKQDQER